MSENTVIVLYFRVDNNVVLVYYSHLVSSFQF